MEIFRVKGSPDVHMIDNGGNHFVCTTNDWLDGGVFKCVNPTRKSGKTIESTYPPVEDRISLKIKKID